MIIIVKLSFYSRQNYYYYLKIIIIFLSGQWRPHFGFSVKAGAWFSVVHTHDELPIVAEKQQQQHYCVCLVSHSNVYTVQCKTHMFACMRTFACRIAPVMVSQAMFLSCNLAPHCATTTATATMFACRRPGSSLARKACSTHSLVCIRRSSQSKPTRLLFPSRHILSFASKQEIANNSNSNSNNDDDESCKSKCKQFTHRHTMSKSGLE